MPRTAKLGTLAVVQLASFRSPAGRLAATALRVAVLPVSLLAFSQGCGPSIQSIHEGSVRFEHCYRLDMDPKIVPSHRHACWEQWTRVYSYGQARDRIEYARRRITELEAGDPEPPRLDLDETETRPEREFYMSMPAPTDAHAPPPPMATTPKEETKQQVVPGDECIIRCRQQRSSCLTACEPKAGGSENKPAASQPAADQVAEETAAGGEEAPESADAKCACEADYKACAARCFE